jgi:hypothetical protein
VTNIEIPIFKTSLLGLQFTWRQPAVFAAALDKHDIDRADDRADVGGDTYAALKHWFEKVVVPRCPC